MSQGSAQELIDIGHKAMSAANKNSQKWRILHLDRGNALAAL
jgi:hypothetical protein